jgi:hypothetical protein
MELPWAYRNMDAVASHGSKSLGKEGWAMLKSANDAFLPFEDRPDPIERVRFLASCPEDIATA